MKRDAVCTLYIYVMTCSIHNAHAVTCRKYNWLPVGWNPPWGGATVPACDVNKLNKSEVSPGDGTVLQKSIEQTLVVIHHFRYTSIHAVAVTQAELNGVRRWRGDRRRPEAETVSLPVECPTVCDVIRLGHTCTRMTLMAKRPSYLRDVHRMNDLSRAALQVDRPVAGRLLARRLQVDDGVEGGGAHHRGLAQVDAHVTHLATQVRSRLNVVSSPRTKCLALLLLRQILRQQQLLLIIIQFIIYKA